METILCPNESLQCHPELLRALYSLGAEPLTIHMVRTGRGSTVKERGGATHYSYGEDR